jgi:hypothetical protein
VLLCCSETFYERELKFSDYGSRVFRLERWIVRDQKAFASALFPPKTWRLFMDWQKEDETGTRERLCKVPLHLSFVLPLVQDQADALKSISIRWHLLDQLARVRLDAAHLGDRKEQLLSELGAIAHHFYVPDRPEEEAIAFNLKDLEDFLRSRNPRNVTERLALITHQALIESPAPARIDYHFEDPPWGWLFVARHLTQLLQAHRPPEPVLKALSKPLSKPIMELCEEILTEEFPRHEEQTLRSLQTALKDQRSADALTVAQRTLANDQVKHLLAIVEGQR